MDTTLKRNGQVQYTGMLVSRSPQPDWSNPTLLLHFVEKTGTSCIFFLTDAALEKFKSCEKGRIYQMEFAGKVVKKENNGEKMGVTAIYRVVLKYPCKLELSKDAWPLKYSYKFVSWDGLNQLPADTCVDIIGKVVKLPVFDANSSIPKLRLELGNGNYEQTVYLLGDHASLQFRLNDIVCFANLKVNEYRNVRSLQTAYLTLVEINPVTSEEKRKHIFTSNDDEPVHKALRMTSRVSITIAQVKELTASMVMNAKNGNASGLAAKDKQQFNITGTMPKLNDSFFENDAPIFENDKKIMMCLRTTLHDPTGTIEVRIWDAVCYELFDVTAAKLREVWEEGNEKNDKRQRILDTLNKFLNNTMTFSCEAEVVTYGFKEKRFQAQINVNSFERVTE